MINEINNPEKHTNRNTIIGYLLLGLGAALLLNQVHLFYFPGWAITWPVGLIAYGIYTGAKHDFKKTNWILYTLVGVVFLLPNIIPALYISIWPMLMIAVGVFYLMRRNQKWNGAKWEKVQDDTKQ